MGRLAVERTGVGEEFVERHAEREDVRARVDAILLALGLLRRHVVRRAGDLSSDGERRQTLLPRQTEVGQHRAPVRAHEHVRRLDVPVDHAVLVGVVESVRNLRDDTDHRLDVLPAETGALRDQLVERLTLDVLHREVLGRTLGPDREHVDDARVLEPARRGRLLAKPRERPRATGHIVEQDLEGHASIEGCLPGLVHHAHATAADLALQMEVAEHAFLCVVIVRSRKLFAAQQSFEEVAHLLVASEEFGLRVALLATDETQPRFEGVFESVHLRMIVHRASPVRLLPPVPSPPVPPPHLPPPRLRRRKPCLDRAAAPRASVRAAAMPG